ncbi:integrase, catalytic region, zinc finger, CCHC-type containing protein [Tanacetum coccineum]
MDPMISLGQKNTLAGYMILSGADNRPPMLDKDLYDSWKSRMELYMQNREHGIMILESVEHGPLIWPTVEENVDVLSEHLRRRTTPSALEEDLLKPSKTLAKDGLARGIPRLKFQKDHLCSTCALGKSKKTSHQPKAEDTNQEKLYLLHVDLCGPTLVEATRTMLIFSKAPLFLWAEAINTACYTQNCSLIRLRYNKTSYELMQDKKPDLSFFHVFGSLCYPTNDHEDLGKFNAKADIGIFVGYTPAKKAFRIYNRRTQIITETIHVTLDELTSMASEQFSSGPGLHYMTLATSSTGLDLNPVSQQPCLPPIRDDWDRLFQPMFNEYFNPPTIVVSPVPEAAAPRAEVLADSLVSTFIDQDASSTSIPSSQEHEHCLIISQGFEESPNTPTFHDDPLNESPSEDSTPQGSSSNVRQIHTLFEHLGRWTNDHSIANMIGDPSRSVSTRKQLETNAMWCYFDAFLTSVEPKNFK